MPRLLKTVKIEDACHTPKDYNLETVGITQSLLGAFQICRMRFMLMINRWEPIEQSRNIAFGNLFHDLLEKNYKRGKPAASFTIKAWIEQHIDKNKDRLTVFKEDEIVKMSIVARVVCEEYLKHWKDDFKTMDFAGVETLFAVQFHGYLLRGKKDGRYDNKKGHRWIMEHKTKGRIVEETLEYMLPFDLQNLYYLTAEELEEGVKVYGALYNIIRNPQHKPKKNETEKEFTERLRSLIQADPAHFFIRYEVPYSEADKKRFRSELLLKLNEVNGLLRGTVPLYRNENACTIPYNCKYLRFCSSGNSAGYFQKPVLFTELAEEVGE
jgi:hypothetical protein